MSKPKNNVGTCSLCWDCANATNPDKCPWVGDGEPVDGWWARKDKIKFSFADWDGKIKTKMTDTYCVIMCPLFERDAWRGGLHKHDIPTTPVLKYATAKDLRSLAAAIIYRQVVDWERLGRGEHKRIADTNGRYTKREDVVDFFNSEWFEQLLACVSTTSAEDCRKALGIPKCKKAR